MYTLMLERSFIARHYLIGGDWGPENDVHSHPYRVEVRLSGEHLDQHGYLVDLEKLEEILDACVARYREQVLNDLPEFREINPSIEHFSKRFFDVFIQRIKDYRFKRVEIRIWENGAAWAAYRENF